jgi:cold-inducible RNA-binding protein
MALRDNRVFLPRLPQGATEDVLKAHFSRFGDIKDCYIPIDRDTGRPKGLAFITFTSGTS